MTVADGRPFDVKPDKILVDRAALKQVLMWAEALVLLGNTYVDLGEGGPHPDNLEEIEKKIDQIKIDLRKNVTVRKKEAGSRIKVSMFGHSEKQDDYELIECPSDESDPHLMEVLGSILPSKIYSHINGSDQLD